MITAPQGLIKMHSQLFFYHTLAELRNSVSLVMQLSMPIFS